jgi:hypothetical protein
MSTSITEINEATEASIAGRTAAIAAAPKPKTAAKPKAAPKPAPKAETPKPKATPTPRKALTPRERAAKPVTATIAAYVTWLDKTVYGSKMTTAQKSAAGISITLYGAFQSSPERKAARGA